VTHVTEDIGVGSSLRGRDGRRIGTVDATFADYLLVRTAGLLPIDLYVPRVDVTLVAHQPTVGVDREEAHQQWHRPLKRAPHPD